MYPLLAGAVMDDELAREAGAMHDGADHQYIFHLPECPPAFYGMSHCQRSHGAEAHGINDAQNAATDVIIGEKRATKGNENVRAPAGDREGENVTPDAK